MESVLQPADEQQGETLVFVYGTLKRGLRLHLFIRDEVFVGEARTEPLYQLYHCGWYPALAKADQGQHVEGELWRVSETGLRVLDEVESVADGFFARQAVRLLKPFDKLETYAYFYQRDVLSFPTCGPSWEDELHSHRE